MNVRLRLTKEDGTKVGRDSDKALFVKANNHRCKVYFPTETLIYHYCLKQFMIDYPLCGFILVHRSHLLNFGHIIGYKSPNRACLDADGIPPLICNEEGYALVKRYVDKGLLPDTPIHE